MINKPLETDGHPELEKHSLGELLQFLEKAYYGDEDFNNQAPEEAVKLAEEILVRVHYTAI